MEEKLGEAELPVLKTGVVKNVSQMINGKDYKFYVNKAGFYRMRLSFETDQTGVLEYEMSMEIIRFIRNGKSSDWNVSRI